MLSNRGPRITLVVLLLITFSHARRQRKERLDAEKWAAQTLNPPVFDWRPTRRYASFLSHKMVRLIVQPNPACVGSRPYAWISSYESHLPPPAHLLPARFPTQAFQIGMRDRCKIPVRTAPRTVPAVWHFAPSPPLPVQVRPSPQDASLAHLP